MEKYIRPFIDSKDVYMNFDKFENNEINFLFITGMMGSGKTTIANEIMDKKDCYYICLDIFQPGLFINTLFNMYKGIEKENFNRYKFSSILVEDVYNFLSEEIFPNEEERFYYDKENNTYYRNYFDISHWRNILRRFIPIILNKKYDKPVIIDGIQLLWVEDIWDIIKVYPIIVKCTSTYTSRNRRAKRNIDDSNSYVDRMISSENSYDRTEKSINKFINYIKGE